MPVRVAIFGTGDTKANELLHLAAQVRARGATPLLIDVSILADPPYRPDYDRQAIATAAGTTIEHVMTAPDENAAMATMARGAVALAQHLHASGWLDAMIALGGSMGTDLALDVAQALPDGVRKVIVSTIAGSRLIPNERIAPDVDMILWTGGLYGLNRLSRTALDRAVSSALGNETNVAASYGTGADDRRPLVGITSLGGSCLGYMKPISRALEQRGFEPVVFHCTGRGGAAFEELARGRRFAAVFDLCLQEISNDLLGTVASAGPQRLTGAGAAGIPQIVAPGAADLADFEAWRPRPEAFAERPYHAHNRLIASVTLTTEERKEVARQIVRRLAAATGPVALVMPSGGLHAWDGPGRALYDETAAAALSAALHSESEARSLPLTHVAAHINDAAFADHAMAQFDAWIAAGKIQKAQVA